MLRCETHMKTSQQIRQQFISFFQQKHAHAFVPSSPVVPHDDPTLLFTNAGMNQFKPIFLGLEKRDYTRVVNTQKCIRAGGKHNDLDDVGRSRRHHTFFEMLGNWSFGDYFKRGAIEMAWQLLTEVWELPNDRLHVSCYEGNATAGIPRDTEAADIWKQVAGLDDSHIHYFGKDNFWEMGDTGPCGPCTEIYIDRTPDGDGGPQVNGEDPRVMEIWNLVFIQYNRDAAGKLTPLPAQHVDTGMGLERICQVIQGKNDNFGTDLWTPLFEKISELSGIQYAGKFPPTNSVDPVAEAADAQLRHDIAFRVVADHVRCLTFALTDGAVPSNEGRGYVLRRILRRAVRFGRQQLGLTEPFLHTLVPVIVDTMGDAFPELRKNPSHVVELVRDEEVSFGRTLDRGIQLFDEAYRRGIFRASLPTGNHEGDPRQIAVQNWESHKPNVIWDHTPAISAADAFKLHDTYGFPIDLTRIMAEERGMTVDIAGYEKLMEQAKELARSGGKETGSKKLTELPPAALAQLAQAGVKPTDDFAKYAGDTLQAKLLAIWNGTDLGLSPAHAFEDEELALIFDRTNFYAEMGGQVGDDGSAMLEPGSSFDISQTRSVGGYVLHIGRIESGIAKVGAAALLTRYPSRKATEQNHTTTHLANWALREVLGDGVQQKGSLVDPEKLRFDFSHGKALNEDELAKVETLVAESIAKELPVYAEEVPQEQALKINGLRAVFGEKYPPRVRVVSVGASVQELIADPGNSKWRQYSIEFCGGTHMASSAEAKSFVVTAEESVSKGIRRLVAVTGVAASAAAAAADSADALIAQSKDAPDSEASTYITALNQAITTGLPLRAKRRAQAAVVELQSRAKAFEKSHKSTPAAGGIDLAAAIASLVSQSTAPLFIGELGGATDDQLRSAVDSLKTKSPSYAVMVVGSASDKVTFVAAVSDDLIKKGLKAGDWVKQAAVLTGGGGGGRPQMAQGSGKDATKIGDALAKALEVAVSTLK